MRKLFALFIALCAVNTTAYTNTKVITSNLFPNVLHTKEVKFFTDKPSCAIFWDLNSVVFTKDTSTRNITRMLSSLVQERGIGYTLWGLTQFGTLWRQKKILKRAGDNRGFVWDAMFTDLAAKDAELANHLRTLSQMASDLEQFMAELLFDLHNAGHHNAVLSNMGQGLLDIQIKRIEQNNRPHTQAVSYVLEFLQDDAYKTIASPDNGWMHKPNANIYKVALSKNQEFINKDTVKIFIDDKKCNCVAAIENGFDITIICDNQHDIRPILKALGIKGL